MNSLLKISAGILLCLPLTGCVGPSYYDPATGMVCGGEIYGPTNLADKIRCKLSEHRAKRWNRRNCNPCDNCCSYSCGTSLPAMLASGTFNYGTEEFATDSYGPQTYASESTCPHCQSQAETIMPESSTPQVYTPETVPTAPATIVPKKVAPVPGAGNGTLDTPAPAPGAEEPMTSSTFVPPALLNPPTTIPNSAAPEQRTRRVQWVPARIH